MNTETAQALESMGFRQNNSAFTWVHRATGDLDGRYMFKRVHSGWHVETKYTDESDHPTFDCPIAAAVYLLMQDPDQ